ncbi:hypothetical protein PG984_015613 [Apiospora sp. TS-2023a]
MQRYTVTIVTPDASRSIAIIVPFQPSARVMAFVDELYERAARRGLSVTRLSHALTARLNSETGALIDPEDVLSDVVQDPKSETIFAIFTLKGSANTTTSDVQQTLTTGSTNTSPLLSVRIVTAANANNHDACPVIQVSPTDTLRQLCSNIVDRLDITHKFDDNVDTHECNCRLAAQLMGSPRHDDSFLVVHAKSVVERIDLHEATETTIYAALRSHLGSDFEKTKSVRIFGTRPSSDPSTAVYTTPPIVSVCSKQRHAPFSAKVEADGEERQKRFVLDLHTNELPVHPACMNATLAEAGLGELVVDEVIDIYCVHRQITGGGSGDAVGTGKTNIFRARPHWQPKIAQSDRGISIFLSSLRVFASLVQDMQDDESLQDAILHVFDLLTKFPPALRTLCILIQGKTPQPAECAALSQAMFESLDSFMATYTDIIGTDHTRVFEGARLFFGYILDKARTLKLSRDNNTMLSYVHSFRAQDLRDYKTGEAIMHVVPTTKGLMEASLFNCFQKGGLLADSKLETDVEAADFNRELNRVALLSAGMAPEVVVFSRTQAPEAALELEDLRDLTQLPELCARNKLAVHMPRQLASSISPCLTFDRRAHLAVYTGEQPCGTPGHSSILSRPLHGDETIDVAVIEQLIASLLKAYQDDGTAAFDQYGGAAVKRLLAPDEVLMLCVDVSTSMDEATEFTGVNDTNRSIGDAGARVLVEPELFNQGTTDEAIEILCDYEGFDDMVAVVAFTVTMLSSDIIEMVEAIERTGNHITRNETEMRLKKLKVLWAASKTHEEVIIDFLIYRATAASPEVSQRWNWSSSNERPTSITVQCIPCLDSQIVHLPYNLRCPISHTLMTDAVTTVDGHTYSSAAITEWFKIRKSSPMTGLVLENASLRANQEVCDAANIWMDGDDLESQRRLRSREFEVTFDSRVGAFCRKIQSTNTIEHLYKLAFRGLKARFSAFQLSTDRWGPLAPSSTVTAASREIRDGSRITIRLADDAPSNLAGPSSATTDSERVLVKVYDCDPQAPLFSYWANNDTNQSMSSVVWKYWRAQLQQDLHADLEERTVWKEIKQVGDGWWSGQVCKRQDQLSPLLTPSDCYGRLGEETIYERNAVHGNRGPLVLKLGIVEFERPQMRDSKFSRLDVLKQMFEAFINRLLAYNYKTHVGLVTFSTKPALSMGISHVVENFRRSISAMTPEGDTALWDALALGMDQLNEYGKKYPQAKKRIICISDGVDNKSMSNTSADVCWRLRQANIVVDSVSLGREGNGDLRTLSYLLVRRNFPTGVIMEGDLMILTRMYIFQDGYRFHPTTLANALAICELEPFLSLTERPVVSPPVDGMRTRSSALSDFTLAKLGAKNTTANEHVFPARKPHPNITDDFIELSAFAKSRAASGGGSNSNSNSGSSRPSQLRTSRLLNEIWATTNSAAHPKYDVYVSQADMSFWKIVMSGPEDSPYAEGTFLLYLHADEGYPTSAPKARFVTRIKHPNVNAHGRICHSILDRDWTTDTAMADVLNSVYALLFQPEYMDPVSTTAALGMHHDESGFADEARAFVRRYATKSREEWRAELLG